MAIKSSGKGYYYHVDDSNDPYNPKWDFDILKLAVAALALSWLIHEVVEKW